MSADGGRGPSRVGEWVDHWGAVLRRATPGPLLVRAAVFASGLLAQLLAWPAGVASGRALLLLAVVGALPALFPGTRIVSIAILIGALGWLISTTSYGEAVSYWRLIALAALLYLQHTSAALAAVLPYDALLSPGVLAGWLRRCGVVVLLTVAVAMFALVLPQYLPGGRYLVASLAGMALVIALAGYLAALVRRSSRD